MTIRITDGEICAEGHAETSDMCARMSELTVSFVEYLETVLHEYPPYTLDDGWFRIRTSGLSDAALRILDFYVHSVTSLATQNPEHFRLIQ